MKIRKLKGWVGVGICLRQAICNAQYRFNYTNIGHGSYLISDKGYTWSHSQVEFNSAMKSFQFSTNDVISMQYDLEKGRICFSKVGKADAI